MWPNGDFTLNETKLAVQDTQAAEVSVGGGAAGMQAGLKWNWQRQTEQKLTERAILIGAKRIEGRNFGKRNAIFLSLQENPSQKEGVVSEVRTAILLGRKNNVDHFAAHVEVQADADALYGVERRFRKICGMTPKTDPIIFDPNMPPTRTDIDKNNLLSTDLESQCDVLSTTMISTIRDHTS
jgi:hypothetical protein